MKTSAMFLRSLGGQSTVDRDNPWPGLLPYNEADQEFFHGRRREIDALARLVSRARMSVLFGLSGLGKSSLLQAGLFPRLRDEDVLPVYVRLDFSAQRPDLVAQVRDAVVSQARAAGVEAPAIRDGDTLWEDFHRRDADFWSSRNRPVLPLLVFDQFEEIFTLGRADAGSMAASAELVDELGELAEGRPPAALKARLDAHPAEAEAFAFGRHHYKILLSLREDFLADLESLRDRIGAGLLNRLRLRPMDGTAAFEVVSEASHLITPEVAEKVVRFVANAESPDIPLAGLRIDPALLSVVCRELNNARRKARQERITAGLLEGSQEEILGGFYERGLGDLGQEVRTFVEEELLVEGFRDSVALEKALNAPGMSREAVDRLVERRLVRIDPRDGVERLELTHDLLTGVVAASRDRRRQQEAAARAAAAREREIQELQERERAAREAAARRDKIARIQLRGALAVLLVFLAAALFAGWQAKELKQVKEKLQQATARAEEALEEQRETIEWYEEERATQEEVVAHLRALFAAGEREKEEIRKRLEVAEKEHQAAESNVIRSRSAAKRKIEAYSEAKGDLPMAVQESLKPVKDMPERRSPPERDRPVPEREPEESIAEPPPPATPRAGDLWAEKTLGMRFRYLPAGAFLMGSPEDEDGREDDEARRRVTLTRGFWMAETEVTQAQWQKLIGRNPSSNSGCEDCPVEKVSWLEAIAFANRLSTRSGLAPCYGRRTSEVIFSGLGCGGFRLPTEAEWEYAARAGTPDPRYGELDAIAWYASNSRRRTQPVGQKKANSWGLYDVLGNVMEWVWDPYWEQYPPAAVRDPLGDPRGEERVNRGCGWASKAGDCRAARRDHDDPDDHDRDVGFRLVRTADAS